MCKFNMRKFQGLARVLRNYVQIDGQKQKVKSFMPTQAYMLKLKPDETNYHV